jgi:hypothetical protein
LLGHKKYIIGVLVLLAVGWLGVRHYRCAKRGAAFGARVEAIERDAHNRLKPGTKKDDLIRFFVENKIPIDFYESEASGTITTSGCSPFGCGSDAAIIGVRVKVDEAGTVKSNPVVVGIYTNCL